MWYNVDLNRWAEFLVPPILRSQVLLAFIKVLLAPLVSLYQSFLRNKEKVEQKLNISCQTLSIEQLLCNTFFLKNREIYITEVDNIHRQCLYFQKERLSNVFMNERLKLWGREEVPIKANFIVHVPTALCTSLDKQEDKYKGVYLSKILNTLNAYKPAGKLFSIELYKL